LYVLLLFKILYFCFGNLYFKFVSEAGASAFLGIYISELDNSAGTHGHVKEEGWFGLPGGSNIGPPFKRAKQSGERETSL
jgi:hypothetical protein